MQPRGTQRVRDWSIDRYRPLVRFPEEKGAIADAETLRLLEISSLHTTLDRTRTAIGSGTLFHSLTHPSTDLEFILRKQESIRELESDERLRQSIVDYLEEVRKAEPQLLSFIAHGFPEEGRYRIRGAQQAGRLLATAARSIPAAESSYLRQLLEDIKAYDGTETHQLLRGPLYQTLSGLKPKETLRFWEPALKYNPNPATTLSWLMGTGLVISVAGIEALESGLLSLSTIRTAIKATAGILATMIFYTVFIKESVDHGLFLQPLQQRLLDDPVFAQTLLAVGKTDEMLSHIKYARSMPHKTTLPTISEESIYRFAARDLKNPVLAPENEGFVGNEVILDNQRLTFVTGPNSGGKTTVCKSVLQNQILAQIGSYVVAESASMGIADMLALQAPAFDALSDEEGRFGTELKRTRDIFYRATPRSLVILDELAEGTTFEEKMAHSRRVLDGFDDLGNATVLVTHNHALATQYQSDGRGQFLQVEFDGQRPTHKLVPGISTHSNALFVAKRIGFSAEDIDRSLKERGYRK